MLEHIKDDGETQYFGACRREIVVLITLVTCLWLVGVCLHSMVDVELCNIATSYYKKWAVNTRLCDNLSRHPQVFRNMFARILLAA